MTRTFSPLIFVENPNFFTDDPPIDLTPGNMRVDYVLPSAGLTVTGAGVFWPAPGEDGFQFWDNTAALAPTAVWSGLILNERAEFIAVDNGVVLKSGNSLPNLDPSKACGLRQR